MTIFELVKLVLDDLYREAEAEHGAKVDEVIIEKIAYLSKCYENLNCAKRQPVDYADPTTRFAYVFKYVAVHGDYIVQLLDKHKKYFDLILNGDNLRLSCIGGGPGSDIVGVLKYIDQYKETEKISLGKIICYLLDKEQAWADTWTELGESLVEKITLNVNFQQLDVTDHSNLEKQKKISASGYFHTELFCFGGIRAGSRWVCECLLAKTFPGRKTWCIVLI